MWERTLSQKIVNKLCEQDVIEKRKKMRGWEKKETHHGFDLREPVKELT